MVGGGRSRSENIDFRALVPEEMVSIRAVEHPQRNGSETILREEILDLAGYHLELLIDGRLLLLPFGYDFRF